MAHTSSSPLDAIVGTKDKSANIQSQRSEVIPWHILQHFATLRVGLCTATRTGYSRVIGNCIGYGRRCRFGSLKQREGVNNPCVTAVLLYYIHSGNKVKSGSNPEIGVEPIGISLPYDHVLHPEGSRDLGRMVPPELSFCSL